MRNQNLTKSQRKKKSKEKRYEMFLDYGPIDSRERVQRLEFKAAGFLDSISRAKKLSKLIKKVGNFKKLTLLAVARVGVLKRYAKMPSSIAYFGTDMPEFVKTAVKAAKESAKQTKKTKLKRRKPVSFVERTITVRS